MKTNFALLTACAFLLGASTLPPSARAADVVSAVEMSTTGTVSKFDEKNLTVTLKFETGTETRYQFSKISRLFDAAGRPLAIENIRPGTRLTVFFMKDGEDLLVSRATMGQAAPIAQNPDKQPADHGTAIRSLIMEVLPDSSTIVVKSDTGASIRYRYNKTTQMVDEGGNMVTLDAIRPGTRATLQFSKVNNEMMLTRIIVVEAAPVISTQQASLNSTLKK